MSKRTRTTLTLTALSSALALALACGEDAPPTAWSGSPAPTAAEAESEGEDSPSPEDEALGRAANAAKQLGKALKTRLVAAMGEGGPSAAIHVCAEEAPGLASQVRAQTGVNVGRWSPRLRNAEANGAAPAWVREYVAAHGEASAAEASPVRAIVDGEARFLAPLAADAVCLNCHGASENLSEEVRAVLTERYPSDQATDYAEGDLRGVLWGSIAVSDVTPPDPESDEHERARRAGER